MSDSKVTYQIRVEGKADSYGLGEEVIPGVLLFKTGHYGLTREELELAIKRTGSRKEAL